MTHELMPVIDHYEDIKIEEHFKIWLSVGRVQTEYVRILRIPTKKLQDKYIKLMKQKDIDISDSYFNSLKDKLQNDDLDKLYIDNQSMVLDIKNKALKSLQMNINNMLASNKPLSVKDSMLVLKTLEMYDNGKNSTSSKQSPKESFARQLLALDDQDSPNTQELQHQLQDATQLRLSTAGL